MSRPTALVTFCCIRSLISVLSPLLRTANNSARAFELFARKYSSARRRTRLGKCCLPRYRAQSDQRESDDFADQPASVQVADFSNTFAGANRCKTSAL